MELSEALKSLNLEDSEDQFIDYEYINVFKNPNKLPMNQIHLEKVSMDLLKTDNSPLVNKSDADVAKKFTRKTQTIPALDKSWLPQYQLIMCYEPYILTGTTEDNLLFYENNPLFLQSLNFLLRCNYHQFWCLIIYDVQVAKALHSFLLNPIFHHQLEILNEEARTLYHSVLSQFLRVYERLITFFESESEYLPEDVGARFLFDKKLLNFPIIITLHTLYSESNPNFVNDLVDLFFREDSEFRDREIEEMLSQVVMTLEMIGGHVCGFESDSVIIPIAIDEKPLVFNINWVFSVVNYLLNTISTLNILLKIHKPAIESALTKEVPYRLSFTYERVFSSLFELLNERKEIQENPELSQLIFQEIALARSGFIDVYNCFVSSCLDKALEFSGDRVRQEEVVETYLKLMVTALEDEYFICDYHERYDVGTQNEMFASCAELDDTRTDYILSCITHFRRHNRLWKTLKCENKTLNKAIQKYGRLARIKLNNEIESVQKIQKNEESPIENHKVCNPSENDIENSIQTVIEMFPHLGDGFVLQCLEFYNYQPSDVITAILEENLAPHLIDIPFDSIRIPPEPKPEEPILAYRGHKPDYDDALKLLNDKKDMKQIKTFILDGIQYTNEFDVYDDEYDERIDEVPMKVVDHGSEDILTYNPNYDDAVSDTSYSENEYDDKGVAMAAPIDPKSKTNFCEDPALIRARREERRRMQGKPTRDMVGKPKGEGQDKSVLNNRQKKSVNKSSRANHSRKSGAAFKRNKGMMPS